MNCREALNAIHEALDHEASTELLSTLAEHVRGCATCAREYAALSHWDRALRGPEVDEPGEAYFGALTQRISGAVAALPRRPAERDLMRPVPRLMPSWGLSWAAAAACLVLGLAFGHLAFPRTLTQTRTVVNTVPGPVRTVTVERIVAKPVPVPVRVEVPVVRWRTRMIERTDVAYMTEPAALRDMCTTPTSVAPAGRAVSAPAVGMAVAESVKPMRTGTLYAAAYRPNPGLTRAEMRALAVRLTTDVGALDRALNSPTLAATLVSNVDDASAELDKAVRSEASEAPRP